MGTFILKTMAVSCLARKLALTLTIRQQGLTKCGSPWTPMRQSTGSSRSIPFHRNCQQIKLREASSSASSKGTSSSSSSTSKTNAAAWGGAFFFLALAANFFTVWQETDAHDDSKQRTIEENKKAWEERERQERELELEQMRQQK